jgi:hypothetical protein
LSISLFSVLLLLSFSPAAALADPSGGVGFALENGDSNGDLQRDLSDGVHLLQHLFLGASAPVPLATCAGAAPRVKNGDSNGDGIVDVSDGISLLCWLFQGGREPVPACGASGAGAGNGNPNPRVIPTNARAFGTTYADLAGAWWNWAAQFPYATNPIVEQGEVDCSRGQEGPVWFLAGTFGEVVTRQCAIPPGQPLFFAMSNSLFWAPEDGATEAEVRAGANAQQDAITMLECEIDGVVLQDLFSYRVESPEGGFVLNDSPLLADFGFPPGDRYPAVADGHWLLIPPLPAGDHVIHFHSEGSFGFVLDVTYAITVGR